MKAEAGGQGSATAVALVAGGTGGHVYPALAVAQELVRRGARVHWFGRPEGLEAEAASSIPAVSYHPMPVSGVRGLSWLAALAGLWRLARASLRLGSELRRLGIGTVLGFGGYVGVPGSLGARMAGARLGIQEQNARPGTATRLLGLRLAERAFLGFPIADYCGRRGIRVVGNPVRDAFASLPSPRERGLGDAGRSPRLLVFGGSQGAACLNDVVPQALAQQQGWDVVHLSGPTHLDGVARRYRELGLEADVRGFSARMQDLLCWADLVVCRSGALTLAEMAAVGVGAVLVPFARAVDDHQTVNARAAVARDAARLLPEGEFRPATLAALLGEVSGVSPKGVRERLLCMAMRMRGMSRPGAAAAIADWALAREQGA